MTVPALSGAACLWPHARRSVLAVRHHVRRVYSISDEVSAEIDNLLIEKVSGRVSHEVMSFGGFVGLGHSHLPTLLVGSGGYRTVITESQLRDAPEFSDDSWPDRDWQPRTHEHSAR